MHQMWPVVARPWSFSGELSQFECFGCSLVDGEWYEHCDYRTLCLYLRRPHFETVAIASHHSRQPDGKVAAGYKIAVPTPKTASGPDSAQDPQSPSQLSLTHQRWSARPDSLTLPGYLVIIVPQSIWSVGNSRDHAKTDRICGQAVNPSHGIHDVSRSNMPANFAGLNSSKTWLVAGWLFDVPRNHRLLSIRTTYSWGTSSGYRLFLLLSVISFRVSLPWPPFL